jgi:DNA gyrase subunit A
VIIDSEEGHQARVTWPTWLQTTYREFNLGKDERVIGLGVIRTGYKLVLVTRAGSVKRTNVEDLNGRTEGNWAQVIGLDGDDDEVIVGGVASDEAQVLVVTSGSQKTSPRALRFEAASVNPQATPAARGVGAIKKMDDTIIGGGIIEKSAAKGFVVLVTEKAHAKRISLAEFPVQGRGGQGVQLWKLTALTGLVAGVTVASTEAGDVDIFSQRGKRLRLAIKDLPKATRAGRGIDLSATIKSEDVFSGEPVAGVVTTEPR